MTHFAMTGATGLLGSQVAEMLRQRGEPVRALVRPKSKAGLLESQGVELVVGNLNDRDALARLCRGADVVVHCAAKVGDWGPWSEFQADTIVATQHVVEACRQAEVGRLVHVSSVSVYGYPEASGPTITEESPTCRRWRWRDHYPRAKLLAEQQAVVLGPRCTIVRPTWIYGPRDRMVIPRLIQAIRSGRIGVIGRGDNLLNMVYVDDVAEGVIRAAGHPAAAGQIYNLGSGGEITQRQLLDQLCQFLDCPPVRRQVPRRLAYAIGLLSEWVALAIRLRRAPRITRRGVMLLSRPTNISSRKAQAQLGWEPQVTAVEGLRRTLDWLAQYGSEAVAVQR